MARKGSFRLALKSILSIALTSTMLALYTEDVAERNIVVSNFVIFLIFSLFLRKRSQNSGFSEIHPLRLIVCL